MKKYIMSIVLTAAVLAQTTPVFGAVNLTAFTDYNTDLGYGQLSTHWAKGNIETLLSYDGISSYQEGDFRANKEISAAELIAIILNVTGNADDLTGETWAEKIMNRAYELEICKETEIPLSEVNQSISREKMALVLVNSAEKLNNEDTTVLKLIDSATIADLSTAHAFYQNAIVKAYSMGLLAGAGLNYQPKESATRAEVTAIVNRLMGYTDRVDAQKAEAERKAKIDNSLSDETPNNEPTIVEQIQNGTYNDSKLEWDMSTFKPAEELAAEGSGGFLIVDPEDTGISTTPEGSYKMSGSGSSGGFGNAYMGRTDGLYGNKKSE